MTSTSSTMLSKQSCINHRLLLLPLLLLALLSIITTVQADHIRVGGRTYSHGTKTTTATQQEEEEEDQGEEEDQEIRNGDENYGNWPYFVRIDSDDSDSTAFPNYVCGGTMIHEDIVLTAASCIDGTDDPGIPSRVVVGPNSNTNTNGTEFAVAGVTIHPTWDIGVLNINTRVNLAILKLARSISDPINVATVNTDPAVPFPDQTLMILGYGQLSTGTYPSQLAGGLLKYQSDCRGFYNTTLNVCAEAYPGNNQIACTGDMGGPVLAVGTNTLVGVQSFVFPSDCDLTTTNGYARVSYSGASEWIRRTICTVSSNPPGYCNTPAPTTMAPSSSPTVSLAPSEAPSSIPDGGKNCALRNTVKAVRNSVTSLYQNMFG